MGPYIAMYALVLLFSFLTQFINNEVKRKRIYCIVIFSVIVFIVGLRHPTMGIDLPGYLNSYHRLHDMSWRDVFSLESFLNYEKGYIIFNKLIAGLTGCNDQFLLFICSVLATAPVGYTIYRKSKDVVLSTIIYLGLPIFLIQYSGIRQSIALGMCFYALNFIEEKKFWKFILSIFTATLFHYTAIIFLSVYFLYHFRIKESIRWLSLIMLPVVYVFRVPLFSVLSLILKRNAIITQTNAFTMMLVFILIYIFIIVLFHGNNDNKANGYMNIYFLACLCQIFSGVYSTAIRVSYYFMIALVLLLPMAVWKLKDKRQVFILRILIIVCFTWFSLDSIIGTYWANAYPHYFWWQIPMYN